MAAYLRTLLYRYFSSILILTTNRIDTFDEAFQSRIHVSLAYGDLSATQRGNLWASFLKKALVNPETRAGSDERVSAFKPLIERSLRGKNLNGREIRNIVQLAATLATHEKEKLQPKHVVRVLKVHEEFTLRPLSRAVPNVFPVLTDILFLFRTSQEVGVLALSQDGRTVGRNVSFAGCCP